MEIGERDLNASLSQSLVESLKANPGSHSQPNMESVASRLVESGGHERQSPSRQ